MQNSSKDGGVTVARIPFFILLGLVFLLPLFAIPSSLVPLALGKVALVFVALALMAIVFVLNVLRSGKVNVAKTWLLVSAAALPLIYLIAALFSAAPGAGLIAATWSLDTFAGVLAGAVLFVLAAHILSSSRDIFYLYLSLLASLVLVILFHALRLVFGVDFLSLGIINNPVASILGSWQEFGIMLGFLALLSLFTAELLTVHKWLRWFLYVVLVAALFFLALVQFSAVWYVVGILALMLFLYQFSFVDAVPKRRLSYAALGVIFVAVFFIVSGDTVIGTLIDRLEVSAVNVRPSVVATFEVATDTLKEDPLLGIGPNQFDRAWLLYKPAGINQSSFWNSAFRSGIGFIPTTLVSVGLLGFLVWIVFLGFVLYRGARSAFHLAKSAVNRYLILSSFVAALYLWIFHILYTPGIVSSMLAFLFTGIFISVLVQERALGRFHFVFKDNPTRNFIVTGVSVAVIVALGVGLYEMGTRFAGSTIAARGVRAFNQTGNAVAAEQDLIRALQLQESSQIYRTLAQVQLTQLPAAVEAFQRDPEGSRERFQALLSAVLGNANRAVAADPTEAANYIVLGDIYSDLSTIQVDGARERAEQTYQAAQSVSPLDPSLALRIARLDALSGDGEGARTHIARALELKGNYTDAVFLLAQLEVNEGNIANAITSVEAAALISPGNPTIFFQLGFLRYSDNRFTAATSAFEQATALNPLYANAKYFLGLSYHQLGRRTDAIVQFEELATLNPDNAEVQGILANLRAGREPFANFFPPPTPPEERETPPVTEPVTGESDETVE